MTMTLQPAPAEVSPRLAQLRRAVRPHMIRRLAGYRTQADAKRYHRRMRKAYVVTHGLLGLLSCTDPLPHDFAVQAVDNLRRAEALHQAVLYLPVTAEGAKARAVALDNLDVAQELVEAMTRMIRRA